MSKGKAACFAGFLWISVLGTLLHYTYEWSGENSFAGLFSAVNESIWEHMKLLFFPAAMFSLMVYPFARKKLPAVLTAWAFAAVLAMALQTVAYYTYSGILGNNLHFVNIIIFYVSAAVLCLLAYRFCKRNWNTGSLWGLAIFSGLAICFFCFTKNPPDLGIFKEPLHEAVTQFSY